MFTVYVHKAHAASTDPRRLYTAVKSVFFFYLLDLGVACTDDIDQDGGPTAVRRALVNHTL
jgi:hypothetical protein